MTQNKLTFTQKMTELEKFQNEYGVNFKVKLYKGNLNDSSSFDNKKPNIVPAEAAENSGNILDVSLKLEDMVNDLDNDIFKIEIVYGPDNNCIWHMDTNTCDPEITDENFERFIKWCKSLDK